MSDYPQAQDNDSRNKANLMNQQHEDFNTANFNSPHQNSNFGSPGSAQQQFAPGPGYDRYSAPRPQQGGMQGPGGLRNAGMGGPGAVNGRRELKIYVYAQPSQERALAFLAGCFLMFNALCTLVFFWHIIDHFFMYMLNVFLFSIGAVIAILNGVWALPTQEMLIKYCYMLHTRDGKAIIMFFLASIVMSIDSGFTIESLDYLTAFFFIGTGVTSLVLHMKETGSLGPAQGLLAPGNQDPRMNMNQGGVNAQDVYGQM